MPYDDPAQDGPAPLAMPAINPHGALLGIARTLGFVGFERQDRDDLDYREVAVWQIEAALTAAHDIGLKAARRAAPVRAKADAVQDVLDAIAATGEAHRLSDGSLSVRGRRILTPDEAHEGAVDRVPDCSTEVAADAAGIVFRAVMAGEMSLADDRIPESTADRFARGSSLSELTEGLFTAMRMIEARARRPMDAWLTAAAEAALAMAEDPLNAEPSAPIESDDTFAVLANIRDVLRAGLAPLHTAEVAR